MADNHAALLSEETDHEQRLGLIIEAAPNAMIMVDGRGRIVLVNSEAERSFGYSRDELLSMSVEDLVPDRFRTCTRLPGGVLHRPRPPRDGAWP